MRIIAKNRALGEARRIDIPAAACVAAFALEGVQTLALADRVTSR
jgi:hypothetical protein